MNKPFAVMYLTKPKTIREWYYAIRLYVLTWYVQRKMPKIMRGYP